MGCSLRVVFCSPTKNINQIKIDIINGTLNLHLLAFGEWQYMNFHYVQSLQQSSSFSVVERLNLLVLAVN